MRSLLQRVSFKITWWRNWIRLGRTFAGMDTVTYAYIPEVSSPDSALDAAREIIRLSSITDGGNREEPPQ